MSSKQFLQLSIGGLIVYLLIALLCMVGHDSTHASMFLVGSLIWIGCIFIWERNHRNKV